MNIPLINTTAWKELEDHFNRIKTTHLRDLFTSSPRRAGDFSIHWDGIYFDYSKNLIDGDVIRSLLKLAEERRLKEHMENMFRGEKINKTENRAVLHTALRNIDATPIYVDGRDVMPDILAARKRMIEITDKIRGGQWKGYSGKKIKNIVNIGIGGSDLGPRMVIEGLSFYCQKDLNVQMVSNVDGTHLSGILADLDPEETLFIVVSKTFTTQETITNAQSAKAWLLDNLRDEAATRAHFLAVSTNKDAATRFGIAPANILDMWDWVGGRYSLTSAVGLSVMIAIGSEAFDQLLHGFHSVDLHFRNTEFNRNIPVIMALLGVWYINFFSAHCHAVIPYEQYLDQFPQYLQQADMESNGKRVNTEGQTVDYATGPIILGGTGTNAQHAFFQLLHQGTPFVSSDFIGFRTPLHPMGDHHKKLLANLLAQAEALAFGSTEPSPPHRTFPGNKPTNLLMFDRLTPYSLGQLIAIYEHKIFVQGIIWDIHSFDQWGVELGKQLAKQILSQLDHTETDAGNHDSSTNALIDHIRKSFK
jgi:glucose-6-phosphate isomerase